MMRKFSEIASKRTFQIMIVAVSFLVLISPTNLAQEKTANENPYRIPPKSLADIVNAPETPDVSLSPDKQLILIMERDSRPSIAELAQPELRLAGLRINPRTNGPSRNRFFSGLKLKNLESSVEVTFSGLPENPLISNVSWSPDSEKIAFLLTNDESIELWVATVENATARKIIDNNINATYRSAFSWFSDSQHLLCKLVVNVDSEPPALPTVPSGPVIQENLGKTAPVRTYQDLMKDSYDESLFDYYLTSQLVIVSLDGKNKSIGDAAIIAHSEPSPDGNYILMETVHRPYSYIVPGSRFPKTVEIIDTEGKSIKTIANLPLAEEIPISFDAVIDGPRSFRWRDDAEAAIVWAEAQDGGDPNIKADIRDKVFVLQAPFDSAPQLLAELNYRFRFAQWGSDNLALITEFWRKNRQVRTWRVFPGHPEKKQVLLMERSYEDRYNDPGTPTMIVNKWGRQVLQSIDNENGLFFIGQGASSEGDRPFLRQLDIAANTFKELWRSESPYFETPEVVLNKSGTVFITRRESVKEPPNYYVRNLDDASLRQLTFIEHPNPAFLNVTKQMIAYKREDGVDLNATLYLPAGYSPDQGPLPMVMWAYPREFKSRSSAGQISGSPHSFVRVSPTRDLVFLAHGYAVLSGPTMPIIGEGDQEPNDTYIEQLVASAKAAVDKVVEMGVTDRNRIAIGGHSYGAFMTANLLAHSDLFAAGIARSGAYNRSLTPFGFQAEERTFWQAPEIYFSMSPFMHAEKINEPMLMIHGMADNNSGTFPIQSERMYHAMKGHGATVRLVMLPHESHGYRSKESLLHMLWEMSSWLDTYVKNRETVNPEDLE